MSPRRNPEDLGDIVERDEDDSLRKRDASKLWLPFTIIVPAMAFAIGGVWGIAICFDGFKNKQEQQEKEIDAIRERQAKEIDNLRADVSKLRAHTMNLQELNFWADSFKIQNSNLVVPKPGDYKVDQ